MLFQLVHPQTSACLRLERETGLEIEGKVQWCGTLLNVIVHLSRPTPWLYNTTQNASGQCLCQGPIPDHKTHASYLPAFPSYDVKGEKTDVVVVYRTHDTKNKGQTTGSKWGDLSNVFIFTFVLAVQQKEHYSNPDVSQSKISITNDSESLDSSLHFKDSKSRGVYVSLCLRIYN